MLSKHLKGRIERHQRVVVLHDSDADGVAAGVVLQLALERGYKKLLKVTQPSSDGLLQHNELVGLKGWVTLSNFMLEGRR